MAIIDEIIAIESFIKARFPTVNTGKQTIPKKPALDTFYVRFLADNRETDTHYHIRANRDYQIVYVAEWPEDIIPKMDALSDALYQTEVVSDGIRLASFSFSQPTALEGGGYVSIGILTVKIRKPREQAVNPIINKVVIRQV